MKKLLLAAAASTLSCCVGMPAAVAPVGGFEPDLGGSLDGAYFAM